MDENLSSSDLSDTGSDTTSARRPNKRLSRFLAGASTAALVAGGSLAGAALLSSVPAGRGPANSTLASQANSLPGSTGSLCGSTRQTATEADTALSCESFGSSSFHPVAAQVGRSAVVPGVPTSASSATSVVQAAGAAAAKSATSGTSKSPVPGLPGAPSLPNPSKRTCESTPKAPSSLPKFPGTLRINLWGAAGGGTLHVKVSTKGVKVCGKAPKAPKIPSAPPAPSLPSGTSVPSLPSASSVPSGLPSKSSLPVPSAPKKSTKVSISASTKPKHHKKSSKSNSTSSSNPVNTVVNGVNGITKGL